MPWKYNKNASVPCLSVPRVWITSLGMYVLPVLLLPELGRGGWQVKMQARRGRQGAEAG